MAKTLLNFVNEVLKKTDVLDSDVGLLTSLSDSARQTLIDLAVQSINEVIDEAYDVQGLSKPKQMRESSITLVAPNKDYALHSSLVTLRNEYHLIDQTNNHVIYILEDGYYRIVQGDLQQDDTGLPSYCAISPINGRLVFDRTPTSAEAGRVYKYRYDTDLELEVATDDVPFSNEVFRALVECAAERFKFHKHLEFSETAYNKGLARARRFIRKLPARASYGKMESSFNITDPFNDVSSAG